MTHNEADQIANFEKLGESVVRTYVNTDRFPINVQTLAAHWLAEREAMAERERDASQAEQIEIARSSKDAAWVSARAAERAAIAAENANGRATAALILAAMSLLITIAGIVIVHRDSIFPPSPAPHSQP